MIINFINTLAFKAYLFTTLCDLLSRKRFILLLKEIQVVVVREGLIVCKTIRIPCGYISKNIYLTIIKLFTIFVAYFIRLLGLEKIVSISSELSIPSFLIISLLVLNTIWLKFILMTKSYYLLSFYPWSSPPLISLTLFRLRLARVVQ